MTAPTNPTRPAEHPKRSPRSVDTRRQASPQHHTAPSTPRDRTAAPGADVPATDTVAASDAGLPPATERTLRQLIELGLFGQARRLLDVNGHADTATGRVLLADVALRDAQFDTFRILITEVVTLFRLGPHHRAELSVLIAEIAMLADNHALALRWFDRATSLLSRQPLLRLRADIGTLIAQRDLGVAPTEPAGRPSHAGGGTALAALETLADQLRQDTLTSHQLSESALAMRRGGLTNLAARADALAVLIDDATRTDGVAPSSLTSIAYCPWIPTSTLTAAIDSARGSDYHIFAEALSLRWSQGPSAGTPAEVSDAVSWARAIHDQYLRNEELQQSLDRTREGWREFANLASNEIRGMLTSLEVATELRTVGVQAPAGLESAIVQRIAALTTMTEVGATAVVNASAAAAPPIDPSTELLHTLDAERAICERAGYRLDATVNVAPGTLLRVNPNAFNDMLRWLIMSATAGQARGATVSVRAWVASRRLKIALRGDVPQSPAHARELGLRGPTVANRAAHRLVQAWAGTYRASFDKRGVYVDIDLPAQAPTDQHETIQALERGGTPR